MIDIIPNWHPIFVHFTIGLLGVSAGLFVVERFCRKTFFHHQLLTVARWNLWLGALAVMVTVAAGFAAFQSAPHSSAAQHAAMLDHRNWALATACVFIGLATWALLAAPRVRADSEHPSHPLFAVIIVGAGLMLAVTGYKGAELVYRHGVGVTVPVYSAASSPHVHSGHETGHAASPAKPR